ncbi:MAG: 50S ribosomal protein L21 [Kiritimatiellae bacterium]|nr:50S ribosomal protein L21 [Kiritimatiellia bacterium]
MNSYAVIQTGGKQYRVEKGNVLTIERLDIEAGQEIRLDRILAISDGKDLMLGTPQVKNAKILAKVIEHLRGSKVVSFKKKRRKGYKRKVGHRQELTKIEIQDLAISTEVADPESQAPTEQRVVEDSTEVQS